MLIMFGKTVTVIGREPITSDHQFVMWTVQLHVDWIKAGRPQSNQGF